MSITLFNPRKGTRYRELGTSERSPLARPLPAWPLYTLLYGYPIIWVLGLSQFVPTLLAGIMLCYMFLRRHIIIFKTQWIWFALIVWTIACTVSLHGGSDIIAWGLRFLVIFNGAVFSVYYFNARERISTQGVLGGLTLLWGTMIVLGWLAIFFPDVRLDTPMGKIMPGSLLSNELVKNYVQPPLAEVQQPWGAPEPFVRPAAPFPYANSWGVAFALLTPVVIALITAVDRKITKILLGLAIIAGMVPAIATSNRGMFIGLGVSLVYVILRQVLAGNFKMAIVALSATAVTIVVLTASGAFAQILGRQEYSDSTGGRAALYRATWEAVKDSPLIGYGTARMNVTVGVSMGTQGYLWALMFCFGLVGLALFIIFLCSSIVATWGVKTDTGVWIHSVPVVALGVFAFYSLDTMQMATMMLCLAITMRSRVFKEGL